MVREWHTLDTICDLTDDISVIYPPEHRSAGVISPPLSLFSLISLEDRVHMSLHTKKIDGQIHFCRLVHFHIRNICFPNNIIWRILKIYQILCICACVYIYLYVYIQFYYILCICTFHIHIYFAIYIYIWSLISSTSIFKIILNSLIFAYYFPFILFHHLKQMYGGDSDTVIRTVTVMIILPDESYCVWYGLCVVMCQM